MTYYGGRELAASMRGVRKHTIQIAEDIPEDKYHFRVVPETRSVGETLSHIALIYTFQYEVLGKENRSTLVGFDFPSLMKRLSAEETAPRTKAQIIQLLKTNGELCANWIESLSESFLAESISLPPGANPPSRNHFDMILSIKEHEMHHRAQLMVIERMLGIVPHLTRQAQERRAAAAVKQ